MKRLSVRSLKSTIINSAQSISRMPSAKLTENGSPKIITPINTAVSGSNAPIMEVEVDPIRFKAIVIRQRERTVGTIASCKACNS